jgi:hypothetical protein
MKKLLSATLLAFGLTGLGAAVPVTQLVDGGGTFTNANGLVSPDGVFNFDMILPGPYVGSVGDTAVFTGNEFAGLTISSTSPFYSRSQTNANPFSLDPAITSGQWLANHVNVAETGGPSFPTNLNPITLTFASPVERLAFAYQFVGVAPSVVFTTLAGITDTFTPTGPTQFYGFESLVDPIVSLSFVQNSTGAYTAVDNLQFETSAIAPAGAPEMDPAGALIPTILLLGGLCVLRERRQAAPSR